MKPRKEPPRPVRDLFAGPSAPEVRRPRTDARNWNENRQRLSEIGRVIVHRYGGSCDTDEGAMYLAPAVACMLDETNGHILGWARTWTPYLDLEEIQACVDEARERYTRRERFPVAQDVGDDLSLTTEEREALGVRTIRPAGMTTRQFRAYAKARKAEQAKARRAAKGAKSRAESAEKLKPWLALGISRRTYYRKQANGTLQAGGTVSSPIEPKALSSGTVRCQLDIQTLAGPARFEIENRNDGADGPTPGARKRAVPPGRAVELPLPDEACQHRRDLIGDWQSLAAFVAPALAPVVSRAREQLRGYQGGPLTSDQRQALRDFLRFADWTHEQFGQRIGLSRQQVTNSLRARGTDGFGRVAAANLRKLVAAYAA